MEVQDEIWEVEEEFVQNGSWNMGLQIATCF